MTEKEISLELFYEHCGNQPNLALATFRDLEAHEKSCFRQLPRALFIYPSRERLSKRTSGASCDASGCWCRSECLACARYHSSLARCQTWSRIHRTTSPGAPQHQAQQRISGIPSPRRDQEHHCFSPSHHRHAAPSRRRPRHPQYPEADAARVRVCPAGCRCRFDVD